MVVLVIDLGDVVVIRHAASRLQSLDLARVSTHIDGYGILRRHVVHSILAVDVLVQDPVDGKVEHIKV